MKQNLKELKSLRGELPTKLSTQKVLDPYEAKPSIETLGLVDEILNENESLVNPASPQL